MFVKVTFSHKDVLDNRFYTVELYDELVSGVGATRLIKKVVIPSSELKYWMEKEI